MREQTYQIYLTDTLRIIGENTAKIGGGSVIGKRWIEIAQAQKRFEKQDSRSAEQIIADIADKAGLIITHG